MRNRAKKITTYTLLFVFLGICLAAKDTGSIIHTLLVNLGVFGHAVHPAPLPRPGISVKP